MNTSSTSLPYNKVNLSLTSEAIDFLSETTNGTSHFAILGQLIKNTSVTPSSTSKRGNLITLDCGLGGVFRPFLLRTFWHQAQEVRGYHAQDGATRHHPYAPLASGYCCQHDMYNFMALARWQYHV